MDPIAIGKKVKEIYPEYAGKSEAELGSKFLLKYGEKGLTSLGIETPEAVKEPKTLSS